MWYHRKVTNVTPVPELGYVPDDAECLEETLAIMEDAELMESLERSRQEAADGKLLLLSDHI